MNHYLLAPANFSDYRDFLNHRFKELKEKNPRFSLQSCSQKSKISKSHLQFIFNKKRHLDLDKFPSLSKALKLTNDEEYFAYLMICKNSNRNPFVQEHFEKILARLRHEWVRTETESPQGTGTSYDKLLHEDFLLSAVHSLVQLASFKEDPEWIRQVLPIKGLTTDRIQTALKQLEKVGALIRDEKGALKFKEFSFYRPNPTDPKGQSVYQKGAQAMADLLLTPEVYKPSVYMLMPMAMGESQLFEAEKIMIDLHHRLFRLSQESQRPTATVYIGNFFLTLARLKER